MYDPKMYESMLFNMIEEYLIVSVLLYVGIWKMGERMRAWGNINQFKFLHVYHYLPNCLTWLTSVRSSNTIIGQFSLLFAFREVYLEDYLYYYSIINSFILSPSLDLKLCESKDYVCFVFCFFTIVSMLASTMHLVSSQYLLMYQEKWMAGEKLFKNLWTSSGM